MIVQFFIPHERSLTAGERVADWLMIIGAFAFVLGVGSLIKTHGDRLRRRDPNWPFSLLALVSFAGMSIVGVFGGIKPGTPADWLYQTVFLPLDATMFSLLAFFIASAAYRTFRARTPEATVLLVAAILVMLARVPIGTLIHERLPDFAESVLSFPVTGAKRGIILGISLGVVATSLRIILGIERAYLGGD
jgi:cell shape-determining protein MreD